MDTRDLFLMTESMTYVLMLLYKVLTLIFTKINIREYIHLIRAMEDDFKYIYTKGENYRKVFFAYQVGTWKACITTNMCLIAMSTSLVTFAIISLMVYLVEHPPGDRPERPLVFPYWAPGVDYKATPAYEIAFFHSNIGCLACAYNYIFVLQTNVVWVRQIAAKAEMIGMCIKDLLEGIHPTNDEHQKQYYIRLVNFRMKEIVFQHHELNKLIESYAKVYKKCLIFEQFISSPLVCMLAYCSSVKIDQGDAPVVMMVLCVAAILVLFTSNYLCTYLRTKLTLIFDACWELRFWDVGPCIKPYLILIMMRCLRPLPLQAPGFQEVSIKTFSGKMGSAYSLFNMLRQTDVHL
ncbi:hypothetical protein ACJJTC_013694 [Scirpophaga incertulas]